MSVGLEVGRALNHVENKTLVIHYEVKVIELFIVRLFENLDIDWDVAELRMHIIPLLGISMFQQANYKRLEAIL